jgi:hypothetical protein
MFEKFKSYLYGNSYRSRRIYDLIRKLTCNRLEQGESQVHISKTDSKVCPFIYKKETMYVLRDFYICASKWTDRPDFLPGNGIIGKRRDISFLGKYRILTKRNLLIFLDLAFLLRNCQFLSVFQSSFTSDSFRIRSYPDPEWFFPGSGSC